MRISDKIQSFLGYGLFQRGDTCCTVRVLGLLVGVCILLVPCQAGSGDQQSAAQVIQAWEFGRSELNLQGWPQGWTRTVGRDFPKYLPVQIVPKHPDRREAADQAREFLSRAWIALQQKRLPWEMVVEKTPEPVDLLIEGLLDPCLHMEFDGGSIELIGPKFPVSTAYAYGLEAKVRCEGLKGHRVVLELQWLDEEGKVVASHASQGLSGIFPWRSLQIKSVDLDDSTITQGQFRIVGRPEQPSLSPGSIQVDSIHIWRLPRLTIQTTPPFPIYALRQGVKIECMASGIHHPSSAIQLQVQDHTGKVVASNRVAMTSQQLVSASARKGSSAADSLEGRSRHRSEAWRGQAEWETPPLEPGFYEVLCSLPGEHSVLFFGKTSLCVLPDGLPPVVDRRFGWSMSDASKLETTTIPALVHASGAGRLKYPIWIDLDETQQQKKLAWLLDRCRTLEMEVVGVLDSVPAAHRRFFPSDKDMSIASILPDQAIWESLLEPVLGQACMSIDTFQLAWDHQKDFTNNHSLLGFVGALRNQLRQLNPEAKLCVPWSALEDAQRSQPWEYDTVHYHVEPALRGPEVEHFAKSQTSAAATPYWLGMSLLPAGQYTQSQRLVDLADTMVHAIRGKCPVLWLSEPFDAEKGLVTPDGQPRQMLLPYLILARSLAGHEYVGSVNMNGATNHFFSKGKQGLAIMWSDKPEALQSYLGENVQAFDLFGRGVPVERIENEFGAEHAWSVGPSPIIIRGIDVDVARWRTEMVVENPTLETTTSGIQSLRVRVGNPTPTAIRGTVSLVAPELVQKGRAFTTINLAPNSAGVFEIPVALRPDATAQGYDVRLFFQMKGNQEYQFSEYRAINVGLNDIQMQIQQQSETEDRMSVLIEMGRLNGPIEFDCLLMFSDRPRERFQILHSGPTVERRLMLPRASELAGKSIWLRCEEIGTGRVLNQRISIPELKPSTSTPELP